MTKQEIENGTVTLTNGTTKALTDYLKDTSIYLINKLKNFEDVYSVELSNTLLNTLGKKWTEIVKAIDEIKTEPQKPLDRYYDLSFKMALSEIIYPHIDEFENVKH